MSKETTKKVEENKEVVIIDKTDNNWFNKKGSNKITFFNDGETEIVEFTSSAETLKTYENKKGEDREKRNFILFTLVDGSQVLVRRWNKLK